MRPKGFLRAAKLASVFCLFALFFAACGGGGNSPQTSSVTPAPLDKQVLRVTYEGGDFDTVDPALTYGNGDPINLIFTGLVAPKADGTIGMQMANSYTVSQDGLTYTFKLKSGLKFSDGTSLTADDVAYSINRTVLPATKSAVSSYLSLLKDYDLVASGKKPTLIGDSVVVQDPTTISLILSKPAAYFLEALGYPTSYVVEKSLITKYGTTWTDHLEEGGGDGPFKVQSYSHTSSMVIVPNPNYYGSQPRLQKITYTLGGNRDSNYKAFLAGQIDYAPVPPADDASASKMPGFQYVPALASRYIGMNELAKPLDNLKIRQAFALAINKDLIVNNIINTSAKVVTPSNHIIPNGIPGYNDKLTGPAGVTGTKGNQTRAQQLLKEGLQEEGYSSVSTMPTITLTYSKDYQAGADTMVAVINEWKQVLGITIKGNPVPSNDLPTMQSDTVGNAGPLQMWYGDWQADYPDPQDWTTNFFGKGAQNNAFNYGQNHSANAADEQAVQDEMTKADVEKDPATRLKMYQDAEQKVVNAAVWVTTYQSAYVYAVNPKLQNWKLTPMGLVPTNDWVTVYLAK